MKNKQLILTLENKVLKARLEDNPTTRNLIKNLPMTLTMHDLYRREKYAKVSGLTVEETTIPHYSRGDISYWTPGEALVIYYEGNQEALNGLIKIGEISNGVESLASYSDEVKVTIDIQEEELK